MAPPCQLSPEADDPCFFEPRWTSRRRCPVLASPASDRHLFQFLSWRQRTPTPWKSVLTDSAGRVEEQGISILGINE